MFPNASGGGELLKIAAWEIIFASLLQTVNSILQGLGKAKVSVIALFIGVVVKTICNLVLVPIDGIYEKGAIIGNLMCQIVAFAISYRALQRNFEFKISVFKILIKPIIASIIMVIISKYFYTIFINLKIYEEISIILGIIIAIICYTIMVLKLKILSSNDLNTLPNGQKNTTFIKKVKIFS